jgi:DNA polymerase III subunit epsilon
MKAKQIIKDRNEIIDFSKELILNKEKYLILDTETTGLGENDVIVQIGILDLDGNVLMDTLVKPTKRKRISSDATEIHGISMEMLSNAPTLIELYPEFQRLVATKTLLIFNAEYDARLFRQTCEQDGLQLNNIEALCIMKAYSAYVGEWNLKFNNYKYQKLPEGDHSAIGDCKATLKIIKEMAETEKIEIPKKWWQFWGN